MNMSTGLLNFEPAHYAKKFPCHLLQGIGAEGDLFTAAGNLITGMVHLCDGGTDFIGRG